MTSNKDLPPIPFDVETDEWVEAFFNEGFEEDPEDLETHIKKALSDSKECDCGEDKHQFGYHIKGCPKYKG